MNERIDINVENTEIDNRDLGETWLTLRDGRVISITVELALEIVRNAIENARG